MKTNAEKSQEKMSAKHSNGDFKNLPVTISI